jgi:hypothetical protein
MEKATEKLEGMDRHSVEALFLVINACRQGGNLELLREAEEALQRKELTKKQRPKQKVSTNS